jgi:hypothetical protein
MGLTQPGTPCMLRSATVRAEVRVLALPLSDIVHLAESRASLVPC